MTTPRINRSSSLKYAASQVYHSAATRRTNSWSSRAPPVAKTPPHEASSPSSSISRVLLPASRRSTAVGAKSIQQSLGFSSSSSGSNKNNLSEGRSEFDQEFEQPRTNAPVLGKQDPPKNQNEMPNVISVTDVIYQPPEKQERALSELEIAEWNLFSDYVDMTLPSKINKTLSDTQSTANDLLKSSGLHYSSTGLSLVWEDLTPIQKAEFAFLINESLHECFPTIEEAAQEMSRAVLVPFSESSNEELYKKYKTMNQSIYNFIRKGGDEVVRVAENDPRNKHFNTDGLSRYRQHLRKHQVFENPEKSTTVFALYPNLRPLARYQLVDSMVCCPLQAGIAIDLARGCRLSQENGTGETVLDDDQVMKRFVLNVSRFMRILPSKIKYEYIFRGRGFSLNNIMALLLHPFNRKEEISDTAEFVDKVRLPKRRQRSEAGDESALDSLYENLQKVFRGGTLFTDKFRFYEGFGKSDTCTIKNGYPMKKHFESARHAINIIGAARTKGMYGGILFLVSDTCEKFPFKNVGLDLLLEMDIKVLYCLEESRKLPKQSDLFEIEPDFVSTFSGGLLRQPSGVFSKPPTKAELKAVEGWFHWFPQDNADDNVSEKGTMSCQEN